jgi:hypothetical protein
MLPPLEVEKGNCHMSKIRNPLDYHYNRDGRLSGPGFLSKVTSIQEVILIMLISPRSLSS